MHIRIISIIRRQSTNLCRAFLIARQLFCTNPHILYRRASNVLMSNKRAPKRTDKPVKATDVGSWYRDHSVAHFLK
jgi:hypothetical protein